MKINQKPTTDLLAFLLLLSGGSAQASGEFFASPYQKQHTPSTQISHNRQPEKESEWQHIQRTIQTASQRTGLPESLLTSLIKKESSFNPRAVSRTGARGLMQLMPSTAHSECSLSRVQLFDIENNVNCGSSYLKKQLDYFGRIDLALAAYNAGPGAVRRAINKARTTNINSVTSHLKPETAPYVKKILQDKDSMDKRRSA